MANPTYYKYINYSLNQPLNGTPPFPIISKVRAPTTSDIGYPLGTLWIYTASNAPYLLTSVVAGSATWLLLESSGGAGAFTTLTSSGNTSLATGTGATFAVGNTTGTITIGGAAQTGAVHVGNSSGTVAVGIGNGTGANTVTIAGAGTGAVNIGNTTGNTSVTGTLTTSAGITATTGNIVATLGNIAATDGNIVLSTAGTFIALPGPVYIYSGAGAPSNALALHVGDMYVNTTAASATTRLYIATAASTWTNVTCAG